MTDNTEVERKKPRPKSSGAQITSAIVGMVALLGVMLQLYYSDRHAQETAARQVYMSYSEASLRYPKFTWPDYEKMKDAPDQQEFNQYKSFVIHMLFAYDEIFKINDEAEWRASFDHDLSLHLKYICSEQDSRFYQMFFKKTRDLMMAEKATHCPKV
jgi:hypothetical protein